MFIRRVGRAPSVSQFNEHLHRPHKAATVFRQSNFILQRRPQQHRPVLWLDRRLLSCSQTDVFTFRRLGLKFEPRTFSLSEFNLNLLQRSARHALVFILSSKVSQLPFLVCIIRSSTSGYRLQSGETLEPSSIWFWRYTSWIEAIVSEMLLSSSFRLL